MHFEVSGPLSCTTCMLRLPGKTVMTDCSNIMSDKCGYDYFASCNGLGMIYSLYGMQKLATKLNLCTAEADKLVWERTSAGHD